MARTMELTKEDIAHRAYELYLKRGGEPGKELDDWVKAEQELKGVTRVEMGEYLSAHPKR